MRLLELRLMMRNDKTSHFSLLFEEDKQMIMFVGTRILAFLPQVRAGGYFQASTAIWVCS
jgi:hypothetical protein